MGDRLITYETIYECVRNEKNREALQKLDTAFFEDVQNYLAEKEEIYRNSATKSDVFSLKETDKISQQLRNVKNLLADLYTRREKKIIDLAINLVRTRSAVVDASNVHKKEKQFFDSVVGVLEQYRSTLLVEMLTPKRSQNASPEPVATPVQRSAPHSNIDSAQDDSVAKPDAVSERVTQVEPEPRESVALNGTQVEFLSPVDAFIDAELNEFGPFTSNDRAVIPSEIANILIAEGKAKEV